MGTERKNGNGSSVERAVHGKFFLTRTVYTYIYYIYIYIL